MKIFILASLVTGATAFLAPQKSSVSLRKKATFLENKGIKYQYSYSERYGEMPLT